MARAGYVSFSINDNDFRRETADAFAAFQRDVRAVLPHILDKIGIETIAFLRSHTSETRPPARKPGGKMTGTRPAHPGGWADVTGDLARAYSYDVSTNSDGVVLTLRNTMEYAIYLEARDGYFVLSGVTEAGGPVVRALRDVVHEIAPGWEVRIA